MTTSFSSEIGFPASMAVAAMTAAIVSSAFADGVALDGGAAPATIAAWASPDRSHLYQLSANLLKQEYLKCERAATQGLLDGATSAECSMLYEELRERVFGGDFDAFVSWWREAR